MSTMEFSESGEISMRTYLSMNYLTGAALLATKARALEADHRVEDWPSQAVLAEHHAFATAAIMMSAAAVEAFVNELFAECRDRPGRNHLRIARDKAALIARVWTEVPVIERDTVLAKYDLSLRLLDLPRLDRKAEPFKAIDALFALRNRLMHYKMVTPDQDKGAGEPKPAEFERKFQGYFADNPLTGSGNPYFPDRVIGHGAAEWSVKSAVTFLDGFCQRLSAPPPYEHLLATFATR
ncbi:MAG: hypothetical protein VB138_09800 [Burkholderia sp.]